jgi:predicted RNA-binding protein with PIN domain
MPFLIDGHNLIGALPHIDLSDPDDEMQLLQLLDNFVQATRRRIVVHFDRGATGQPDPPGDARLEVHFAGPPRNADQAISDHLRRLGGDAKNWTVVSSDRAVQIAARHAGAKVLSSHKFAQKLTAANTKRQADEKPEPKLDQGEIEQWQRLFNGEDDDQQN